MTATSPRLRFRRHTLTAALCAVALALPTAASAQQRAGGNGRALDANPQAGSGGNNRLEGQVDYGARNDVVTGNVTGGRQFRDSVGYRAPGEFGDAGGSDELFDFQRRSFGSAPGLPNSYNNTYGGGGATGSPVTIYRQFSDVPSNRLAGPTATGQSTNTYDTYLGPQVSGLRVEGGSLRGQSGSTQNFDRAGGGRTFGYANDQNGRALELTASPLLGVRQQTRPNDPIRESQESRQNQQQLDERYEMPGQDALDEQTALEGGNRLDGQIDSEQGPGQELMQRRGLDRPINEQITPSLVLGRQLTTRLNGESQPQTLDQQLAVIQSQIFRPLDSRVTTPGSDPYLDILRRIRGEESAQDQQNPQAENQQSDANESDDQAENEQSDESSTPSWLQAMQGPDEQRLAEAERRRDEAIGRQSQGQPGPDSNQSQDSSAGGADDPQSALSQQSQQQVDELIDQLTYDAPRLETLVGQREDRMARQMGEGEQSLANGNFFEAEQAFRGVLTDDPNDPLGRVGLIHSQLAAGMIRSASLNLRRLFEDHPELIATRYEENLLPPGQRLQWLQQELSRMIEQGNFSANPGLMMAYLGYQANSRQLIRYGLAIAETQSPRDTLLPVLRRIWLGNQTQNADNSDNAAAGAESAESN